MALLYYMPDTLSQTKAIYAKAARSSALRRARLLREKETRSAARSTVVTPTVTTSSPPRVSQGKQQLLQLRARLASEQKPTPVIVLHTTRTLTNNQILLYL
jgi:hypothetical protein